MTDKIHIPDMEYLEKIWKEIETLKIQVSTLNMQICILRDTFIEEIQSIKEYLDRNDKDVESIWNEILDYDP